MKVNDLVQEGYYDVNPKLAPYVKMGQKIASALEPGSGVKWLDDEQWNLAAALGTPLTHLGSAFGPRSPQEALDKAGVSVEDAKKIFALVKDVKIGAGVKDVEPEPEDDEEDS
mgnify:CR=1 FL=1|jgi:hypothetical protein